MSNQLTEEQIWEEVETWVNSLLEEGYDLSEYTWEEMYEVYLSEGLPPGVGQFISRQIPRMTRILSGSARAAHAGAKEPAKKLIKQTAGKAVSVGIPLGAGAAGLKYVTGVGPGEIVHNVRKIGHQLAGKELPDSKPATAADKPSTPAPTELKGKQVLAKKGGVEGVLDKGTGEWKSGSWSGEQSKRYKEKSTVSSSYEYNDPFDLVLEYLVSQGHVDTLEEALYVMMEMSAETIQDICESKKWIQKAIKHPGALSKQLGVPEKENIPTSTLKKAAKGGGKTAKRAKLAMTLKSFHKK